jgi:hypothetical protein
MDALIPLHTAYIDMRPGNCGACWDFAAIAALEGANAIATGKLTALSEQGAQCSHLLHGAFRSHRCIGAIGA